MLLCIRKGLLLMEKLNNNRIKQIRLEQNKKQKEVANFLGITEQALSYYERGKREPKLETWQKLADYFDVPIPYLQGLGVSKDNMINLMIFRLRWNEQYGPSFLIALDHLKEILQKRINDKDMCYLNNKLDNAVKDEKSVIKFLMDHKKDDELGYLISEHLTFIDDYNFLASLPSNRNNTFYPQINDRIWQDNKDILIDYAITDNEELLLGTAANLSMLDEETIANLSKNDERKKEISYRLVLLFELLATEGDNDEKNDKLRTDIKKLLDMSEI